MLWHTGHLALLSCFCSSTVSTLLWRQTADVEIIWGKYSFLSGGWLLDLKKHICQREQLSFCCCISAIDEVTCFLCKVTVERLLLKLSVKMMTFRLVFLFYVEDSGNQIQWAGRVIKETCVVANKVHNGTFTFAVWLYLDLQIGNLSKWKLLKVGSVLKEKLMFALCTNLVGYSWNHKYSWS